jgi:hypothetical protein
VCAQVHVAGTSPGAARFPDSQVTKSWADGRAAGAFTLC